ncbi:MAG: hypothetical protein ACFFA4_11745 [Promethearchaeota archaeon]
MENWKKWLIISLVFLIICGVGATIIYVISLFAPDDGILLTGMLELGLWWIILLAFLIGLIIPFIAWIINKYWLTLDI